MALERASYEVIPGDRATRLVSQLELELSAGQLTVLLGPNGSGKTTTLRLLAGLIEPTTGAVRLDGEPLRQWTNRRPRSLARLLAYVPQSFHSVFDFTVEQLVGMARFPHRGRLVRWGEADRSGVEDALERLHLLGLRHRLARTLSGGELQRVQLARCLAGDARVLLLDEPTANLDLASSLEVLEICRELAAEGRLVLMTLHDLSAARRFAGRVVLLHRGEILAAGTPEEVLDRENIRRVFSVDSRLLSDGAATTFWFDRLSEGGEV